MSIQANHHIIHCICCNEYNHSPRCHHCIIQFIQKQQEQIQQLIERRHTLLQKLHTIVEQNNNAVYQQYCRKKLFIQQCQKNITLLEQHITACKADHKKLQRKIVNINNTQVRARTIDLQNNKYVKLQQLKQQLQQYNDNTIKNTQLYSKIQSNLYTTRNDRVTQLNRLYPVVRIDNTHCSINDLILTDMIDLISLQHHDNTTHSAASSNHLHHVTTCLGYIVFLLMKLSVYCNVKLPHAVQYKAAQSLIYESNHTTTSKSAENNTKHTVNNHHHTTPTSYNIDDNYKQYLYGTQTTQNNTTTHTDNKDSKTDTNKCYALSWAECEPSEFRHAVTLLGNNIRYLCTQYGINESQLKHTLCLLPNILLLIQQIQLIARNTSEKSITTPHQYNHQRLHQYPNLAQLSEPKTVTINVA